MAKYCILIVEDEIISVCMVAYWIINVLSEVEKKDSIEFDASEVKSAIDKSFVAWDGTLLIDVSRNAQSAINKINSKTYDLIILDGNLLCGEHGREVLREMNSDQKKSVIVNSGDESFLKEAESQSIYTMSKATNMDILRDFFISMGLIKLNV